MRFLAALLVTLLAAAPLAAQSLAEAAKREKERREKVQQAAEQAAKSYTESDLKVPKGATSTEGPPASTEARDSSGSSGAESARERGSRSGDEESWRARAEEHRTAVSDAEKRISDLSAELERVRIDREPPSANVMDPNREQKRQAEIGRLQSELTRAQSRLGRARQELVDFEEEARRAGIPPGWIRQP